MTQNISDKTLIFKNPIYVFRDLVPGDRATYMITSRMNFFGTKLFVNIVGFSILTTPRQFFSIHIVDGHPNMNLNWLAADLLNLSNSIKIINK